MKRKLALAMVTSVAALLLALPVTADELDVRVRAIAKQLQCPVCESVTVADSPAELAVQMRGVIRAKLEAGEPDSQILSYFVDRYGDGILVEPPRRGVSLIVWLGPVVAISIGVILLIVWMRTSGLRRRVPVAGDGRSERKLDGQDLEAVRRELASLRGAPKP